MKKGLLVFLIVAFVCTNKSKAQFYVTTFSGVPNFDNSKIFLEEDIFNWGTFFYIKYYGITSANRLSWELRCRVIYRKNGQEVLMGGSEFFFYANPSYDIPDLENEKFLDIFGGWSPGVDLNGGTITLEYQSRNNSFSPWSATTIHPITYVTTTDWYGIVPYRRRVENSAKHNAFESKLTGGSFSIVESNPIINCNLNK